jgi:leucyl-tRNA synthetase
MSKSKKNVVNPDSVLKRYGADAFRLYEMFMGGFEDSKPWDMRSIEGVARFLRKVWVLIHDNPEPAPGTGLISLRHRTIKKVTDDIETFGFNTAISALMIYTNEIQAQEKPARADLEALLTLLHPFAPHTTEELWERLLHKECLARQAWPRYEDKYLHDTTIEYAVQVNGKLRGTFTCPVDTSTEDVKKLALDLMKQKGILNGHHEIVKVIVVPKKLVNIVVKG